MRRYWVRMLKYLVLLCLLFLALMALMYYTGSLGLMAGDGFWDTLQLQLFHTERGRLMIPAILLLALFYPRFGFVKRVVSPCSLTEHRQQIENAFKAYGFEVAGSHDEELIFRAGGQLARLQYLFEDEIFVRQQGEGIEIEGIRRAAVKVAFRLEGYLSNLR